jgi:hypothetical protein
MSSKARGYLACERYVASGFQKVHGWASAHALLQVARLDELPRQFIGQTRNLTLFGEPVLHIAPLTLRRRITRTRLWQTLRSRVL